MQSSQPPLSVLYLEFCYVPNETLYVDRGTAVWTAFGYVLGDLDALREVYISAIPFSRLWYHRAVH